MSDSKTLAILTSHEHAELTADDRLFCELLAQENIPFKPLIWNQIKPEDIDAEQPLFVEGLGLDSIDALELGLALQKRYGLSMAADSAETRRHCASIRALAEFVASHRKIAA